MIEYNGFLIVNDEAFPSNFRIKHPGKGSVVLHLRGLYTKVELAKQAIDSELNKKGKGNGKQKESVATV